MNKRVFRVLIALITALAIIPALASAMLAGETEVAKNMSTNVLYTSVETALSEASSGQTVMLIDNAVMTADAEIKSGVTLLVPYTESVSATEEGTTANASAIFAAETKTYRILTVEEGATLTVNGTLTVGGIIGYPSQYYQGHTSGSHGRIVNNGVISVASGTMRTYGFVEGSGSVDIGSGGKVYEPFVVFDFAGGANTRDLNSAGQPPFTQYTMQNISCDMTIAYGGRLYGMCNLYAGSQYNTTDQIMIGTANDSALVKMASGGSVSRSVDKTRFLSGATATSPANYGSDIGRVSYTLSGGATFGSMSFKIKYSFLSVSLTVNKISVPYCLEYNLLDGAYSTSNTFYVMPGGAIRIGQDASFSLNGTMYVFDGLRQSGMSGRFYPSTEKLAAAGFATGGVFVVDGSFSILKNATFGGIVQTTAAGASVTVNSSAIVNKTGLTFGGCASYDDNTVVLSLKGRLLFHDAVTDMVNGTTYTSYTGRNWTLEGYDITKYTTSNGTTSNQTYAENVHVTSNPPMNGEWTFTGHTIVTHPAQKPSCTEPGWDEYYTCEECPEYSTYAEIPATGHDYAVVSSTEATYGHDGVTVCSCSNCGDTYEVVTPQLTAAQFTVSLSLEDSIGINFYVKNVDANAVLDDFLVVYSFRGEQTEAGVTDRSSNRYTVASCAAKEAGDSVSISVFYQDELIKEIDYSVRQYCESVLGNPESDEKQKAVCLATLDYAASAQAYFEYETDAPVNATYSAGDLSGVSIPAELNLLSSSGACDGITRMTVSLALESRTELNFYFTPAAGVSAGDLTVTLNGEAVTEGITVAESGVCCLTVKGISGGKLADPQTVSVAWGGTVKTVVYSPLSWAYAKQNGGDAAADLSKAFYRYYLAAAALFGN